MYLRWFHIQDFSDFSLHNQEMGIIDIQLYRTEEVLNSLVSNIRTIDKILIFAT